MYHTSAKLTFGGGEKYLGIQKAPGGAKKLQAAQEAYKKTKNIVATFFLGDRKKLYFVGAPKITPLECEICHSAANECHTALIYVVYHTLL